MRNYSKSIVEILPSEGIIIIGEIHGTKEIPKIFTHIIEALAKKINFTVCVEVPKENQPYFNIFLDRNEERYLRSAPFFKKDLETDGRNSKEFFLMLKGIGKTNKEWKKHIHIQCIDTNNWDSQDQREEELAKNILQTNQNEIILVLVGSVHAAKKPFSIHGTRIEPMAYKLITSHKKKVFSLMILPEKGEYFNLGRKVISGSGIIDTELYDSGFKIPIVHPCTFIKASL